MIAAAPTYHGRPCAKTFTVKMDERAINATFRGTKNVSRAEDRRLDRYVACSRNQNARPFLHAYWHRAIGQWKLRRHPPAVWSSAIASWFDDSGATGCGFHVTYGFATLPALTGIGCGESVTMTGPSNVPVRATREDSGPYVAGRQFDLNPSLKATLGCGDICSIRWHR